LKYVTSADQVTLDDSMLYAKGENSQTGKTTFVSLIKPLPVIFNLEDDRIDPHESLTKGTQIVLGIYFGHYSIGPENKGLNAKIVSIFVMKKGKQPSANLDPLANPGSGKP
jgi:hypothetical protein